MMIGALLIWIPLIVLAVWGATRLFPGLANGTPGVEPNAPLDILARRYARGEIGREEYEQIRRDIQVDRG